MADEVSEDEYGDDGLVGESRQEFEGDEVAEPTEEGTVVPASEATTDSDYSVIAVDGDVREPMTFTSQPTPPYYFTDKWISGEDLYVCVHERSDGESFSESDWALIEQSEAVTYVTTTQRTGEYITDFSQESIAAYIASGAKAFAVYDDGTEVEVQWSEVHDPTPEDEEFITEANEMALANNQHFWSRTTATDGAGTGSFVTDDEQDAFIAAAAAGFPDLGEASKTDTWEGDGATKTFTLSETAGNTNYSVRVGNSSVTSGVTKTTTGFTLQTAPANGTTVYAYYATTKNPWHNILMNSLGIALRMGLRNLLSITKGAVAFYDGEGNNAENVVASFGANGAQVGKSTENHTVIDARGVSSYDGQGNLAPMRASYFNEIRADQLTAATAYIESLTADNITATNLVANIAKVMNLTAEQLSAATAYIATLDTNQLTASNLVANVAKVANLTAEQLSAATAYIASLNANSITANQIAADHATVSSLNANYAHINNGVIDNAKIGHADVNGLSANYAHVSNGVIDNAKIGHADVNGLSANYATISSLNVEKGRIDTLSVNTADIDTIRANSAKVANLTAQQLEADHATIGTLDANYMHADMSNSDVAWIQNGTIKDGSITNAMINSVSANKLTAGTIDASNITVTNLNADNITAGTINGQRIGTGSLSLDKLSDDVYTESEVDSLLATMQSEIDGAIETWTGTAVPTLNNAPASAWSTNADKDKHVGDVYFVVNSQSQQNGYNYRFTKSGNTYSWQLIKDTDITNALSRLSTAEGKITTFDSDITTLKTDTGTLKTKTQSLETSLGDKVDVTTFNDLEDTVDGHSQTISQHTTAISNKADNSTVTSVTNRVSKNEQDISGINTTIGELSTTLESKADGSTVESVSNRLNTVSNTVDGHTQSITSINSTLATKADSSTVSSLTTKVNTVSDTVDGHTQTIGSVQTTQTQMQGKLDKTIVETIQLWYSKSSTDAPGKPTSQVTSTSTAGNAWRTVVPAYSASYPNYFYCYQWKYTDGTYGWSSVTRDIAMGESQERARTAITNAAAADTKAGNAASAAATAQSTADGAASDASKAKTDAASAVSTANSAATDASTALSTANTANTNASNAVSTANTANTNASAAVSTANTAASDASTAKTNASTAVSTANTAKATADKNVKSTLQLWYTKANDTAPSKPTSKVTSNSVSGNAWRVVVPTYSASYPYYFYCYQYELADGTCTWSDVVYDRATTENQSNSRSAVANVSTLTTKTNTISDTVDGHTSQLSSITNTQTSIQGSAVKSTVQLWFTKANTTAPSKPTAHITTDNASTANAWNLAVPTYNASYPNYFYCYEYEYLNGTYGWSAVTRDIATGEAQSTARTAASDASTAKTNAATAVSTANTANTNASNAVSTANTANTNASNAVSTANTAASDASTAKTNAATAVSTANTANTNASAAVSTANTAKATADKNVKETILLWYSKANSTAPSKPTSAVTSTSTSGNAWSVVVPTYSASYPYYFYCYQYKLADGTYTWSDVVYDQATTEAQSTARAVSSSLATYITSNDAAIQSLQNQVDGQIEAWYYSVDPTTSNVPASDWTTDALKARHEGDLYYNVTSGHSWRWLKNGSTYSWQQIPDSDAAAALAAAQNAQNTANNKRRIFTATPTVPYDKGDLWVNGSVVKYATTARSSGNYTASDWSTTATDDTAANAAQATADKNLKESQQLWFTKANSTAPGKPTAKVTSTATTGNAWTTRVPTYNASYKYYFYCMQYIAADGTVTWSDVIYDQATTEAQSVARAASADLTEFHQEYATFKQTTQNFESTVGETYATKTALQSATDDISSLEDQVGISLTPYTEVEWVESNGSQYVYLDWKPDVATFGFEADFIIRNAFSTSGGPYRPDTNTNGYGSVFGTRNSSSVNDIQLSSYSANGLIRFGSGGSASYSTAGLFKTDKSRQQISLRGTSLRRGDGTTVTVTRGAGTSDKFYANMMVFAMHEGVRRSGTGGFSQLGTVRIYSLKFYDGDTLAVDLVGAIRNRDNTTGLYDKVRGHFYPAPKMTYGDEVGDLGEPDTLAQTIVKKNLVVDIDNQAITRMLSADVPELDKLEDGQQITVTFSSNISATTPVAAGLVGWDEASTTAYTNVYLKLTLADGSETEWVPCYYAQGTRLTSHYGSATPISLTYRENVTYGATVTSSGTFVMRAWYADPSYNTDERWTVYSDAVTAGLNGVKPYSLNMRDVNGNWTSVMNEASNVNATGKTAYTGGLQLGNILYHASGSNIAAGNNTGAMKESQGGLDLRYDVNGVTSTATTQLQLRKPLYFVGTVKDDGYYYLDQTKWWTQTEFETGKVYIQIGTAYGSYYAVFLSVDNSSFIWDGEKLVEYTINKIAESTKQYDSDTEVPLVVGDNAATAPLRSYEGAGHAEQFTTTGKNLLQNKVTSRTINGVTFTVNADGSVTANGTASADAYLNITGLFTLQAGTYVLSGCPFGGSRSTYGLYTQGVVGVHFDTGSGYSFTHDGSGNIEIVIVAYSGTTCNNLTFYPQLEAGSTATDYEPYTGGAPSPSPDYPQEIKVVRGRNLLPTTMFIDSQSDKYRISHTDDGGIRVTQTAAGSGRIDLWNDPQNPIVITSDCLLRVDGKLPAFDFSLGDASSVISGASLTGSAQQVVVHAGSYTRISLYLGLGTYDTIIYPQLTEGSTPQLYVPYGHVGMEVGALQRLYKENYSINASGVEISTSSHQIRTIAVKPGAAYFCHVTASSDTATTRLHAYDANGGWIKQLAYINYGGDAYINVPDNATEIRVSVARTYRADVVFAVPIPLPQRGWVAGLSDSPADMLMLDSAGKVEWELNDAEVVLDGSENGWGTSGTNGYYLSSNAGVIPDCKYAFTNQTPCMSNLYPNRIYTWSDSSFGIENRTIWAGDRNNARFGSLAGFKTFLASANLTILYPLATPITEECGYIDMPQVSEGCIISIPELEDSGISWWCKASESMANVTTAIEKRVTTAETSITQTKEQILLKANASDVYTKTQTDGLIDTEVTNRNAAIQLASNTITSTVSETYATKTETSDAKTYVANAKANYGYQYTKNIIIYGESSKYYPVYFTNPSSAIGAGSVPQTVTHEIMIRREYLEQAPSDWNTSTHKGGLNIHFGWNFGDWGGATYKCEVYEFTQIYSTMVGDIQVGANNGIFSIVYLRGGGTTGALYHIYSSIPFNRHDYMINAGVVGEDDVPFVGLEQGVRYAQYPAGDNPTYEWNVRAPLTAPNTTHLDSLYTVQRTALVESRISTAETAIQQTANNVLIKATQSDTTAAQGGQHLIQSLINVAPSGVKIDASKINITGDAVFSAINNDTGTTKISGGKIDATSITLGYSQITNTPAIPTKTSDLTNDSYYATTSQAQGYADAKDTAIAAAAKRTYVSIRATAVDYSVNTATLEATLYIDGTATTTGVTYVWMKDGTAISGATSRTYSVPASNGLNHAYSCKCTATV